MSIRPSRAAFPAASESPPGMPPRAKARLRPRPVRQRCRVSVAASLLPVLLLAAPTPSPDTPPFLTGEQVVRLTEALPAILMAAASLVVSLRARQSAQQAQDAARDAHERAAEAAREQINFALRRQVGSVLPSPPQTQLRCVRAPSPGAAGEGESRAAGDRGEAKAETVEEKGEKE